MDSDFSRDAKWFVMGAGSLKRMLPFVKSSAGDQIARASTDLVKLVDQHGGNKILDENNDLVEFSVKKEFAHRAKIIIGKLGDATIFYQLLPRMALVSLVSLYDAYLGRLVRLIYKLRPEMLSGSGRQLTFAQLTEFPSIEAARDHVVEMEVESLLRDSHTAQFEWLEAKLGLSLRKNLDAWPVFIEATERRNTFVHADGIVGAQYLNVCRKAGIVIAAECVSGSKLDVTPEYFSTACDCFCEIVIKLSQVVWRKLLPGKLEEADKAFIDISFDLLVQADYKLAEKILSFAADPAVKHVNKENELYLVVNHAIALRAQERISDCNTLLDKIDWSALSDKFRLAEYVLRGDYGSAVGVMEKIGSFGHPGKAEYKTWPLFNWFRESAEFELAYERIFNESFRLSLETLEIPTQGNPISPATEGDCESPHISPSHIQTATADIGAASENEDR
ncbi:hypothetical protein RKE25_20660 [Dyella sp. BiH032]|uniref:hypothetical protein n=1 Tax=Dyella sp. BiH032 TaxID=3075430 RepID=UPI002892D03A|nr:hypothetical protein [Dyella sp. BiH032]WNL45794.1 hypothetical protein RKE25_20660 [Dyella sp. BiH032]